MPKLVLSKFLSLALLAALAIAATSALAAKDSSTIRIQSLRTHSRISFSVGASVQPQFRNSAQGFELEFKGATLADLGAPFGAEAEWVKSQQGIQDERLASLKVLETSDGVVVKGVWKYPKGDQAPAHPQMETFDYRDQASGKYMIDFWVKKGPTVAEVRVVEKKKERELAQKKANEEAQKRQDRRLAREKARAASQNILAFCGEPLSDENSVFLSFLPVHEPFQFEKWYSTKNLDAEFKFEAPREKDEEATHVRLAINLYNEGKFALAVRAIEFLEAGFPKTKYKMNMKLLKASALQRLDLDKKAQELLDEIVAHGVGTREAMHIVLFRAIQNQAKKNYVAALEGFFWLAQNYAHSDKEWIFHAGAAEMLYELRQTERAIKEYQWLVENSKDQKLRAEAGLRIGDLYLQRRQYDRAVATYFQWGKQFQDVADHSIPLMLNRAEAFYGLGRWDEAQKLFETVSEKYQAYPASWRAAYRLGEIFGRKKGEAAQQASRQWFFETVNRYPTSRGSVLARMRLAPCGDHGGLVSQTAQRFFETETTKFEGGDEVLIEGYDGFRVVSHLRTLLAFDLNKEATDRAIHEIGIFSKESQREVREQILRTVKITLQRGVRALLDQGKNYEALAYYRDRMEKLDGRVKWGAIEGEFLLKLSQAASELGLGSVAKKFSDDYLEAQKNMGRELAAQSDQELDREDLVVKSEQNFSIAKALWVSQGEKAASEIREHLNKVMDESHFAYEREVLLGVLDEKDGKKSSALAHAQRAELLGGKNPLDHARLLYWIARLTSEAGDTRTAVEVYRKLQEMKDVKSGSKVLSEVGLLDVPSLETLIWNETELLTKQGRWGEAAKAFEKAVGDGLGGNRFLYHYAQALEGSGQAESQAEAKKILDKLTESKVNDFWKKLAMEKLGKTTAKEGTP